MTPGAAVLVALLSQSAAGSTSTTVRLDVRAPTECTSRDDLAHRITARSPRIGIAENASVAAQVVVTIPRAGNVLADIRVGPTGIGQAPRRVVARSCEEAADSAALIIAVTLDPSLMRPSSSVRPEGRKQSQDKSAADRAPLAAVPATPLPRPEQPRPVTAEQARHAQFGATLNGQTMFGAVPGVLPGGAVYLMAALDRRSVWAPALFLGAMRIWRSDVAENGGAASFTLDAISVDACPLALRWGLLAARPCASAVRGRLASQGSKTAGALNASRPFEAVGAALAASFGWRWQLSARLGLGVTLLRDSYEFGTNVFYRAAPLTFSASVGAGVLWH
jgi:hypothetical protein